MQCIACGQALHLGDIVKSRRVRGTREETRKQGVRVERISSSSRVFAVRSRVLARLGSLTQIKELAHRLCNV